MFLSNCFVPFYRWPGRHPWINDRSVGIRGANYRNVQYLRRRRSCQIQMFCYNHDMHVLYCRYQSFEVFDCHNMKEMITAAPVDFAVL